MIRIPMDEILKNFLSEASQEPTPYDCSDLSVDAIVSLIHTVVIVGEIMAIVVMMPFMQVSAKM